MQSEDVEVPHRVARGLHYYAPVVIQDPSWPDNKIWEELLEDILIFTNMQFVVA